MKLCLHRILGINHLVAVSPAEKEGPYRYTVGSLFYNKRDVEAWPPAEVPEIVNIDELRDVGLTAEELVATFCVRKF